MDSHVIGIDHLGVAVKDPKERIRLWTGLLGLPLERVEEVASEKVRTWFIDVCGAHVELLEPTADDSPVAKTLEKRGEGIAHMALRVDDLEAALADLAAGGVRPLPPGVRPGAGNARVAFLHPKDTGGILLELCERPFADLDDIDDEDDDDRYEEPFGEGTIAVLYLREPRQKLFGVIRQLDTVGVGMEGLDVEAFESWVSQWSRGEEGPLVPSLQYYPLHRVEKIVADDDSADIPSFKSRFETRTGKALAEAFGFSVEEAGE
ncbi:MAG: methylmalonyl-CoA epimerase [Candidatus Polarisedimenticolia bacterium]